MMQRHHPEQFMATENTETHRKNSSKSVLCSSGFPSVKICAILWLKQFIVKENTPRPKCSGPNGRNTQKEFLKKRSLFFRFSSCENLCHSVAEKIPGYTPDRESAIFYFKAALNNAKSFYTIIRTFL